MRINRALLGGSLILLITFNLFNLLNFIFHFFMARMLSAVDYGILATLFSIIYLLGIFSESIQTVVVKYSASEKDSRKLKNFAMRSFRKLIKVSSFIFIAYIFASIPLSYLLDIPYLLLTSTGLIIFAAFMQPITRGMLQGRKMFSSLGFNMIAESFIKLGLSVLLVFLGWKVYGAMVATILASVIAFVLSIMALKKIMKSKEKRIDVPEIYSYTKPVLFVLFSILIFYSLDIIIAKMVFPAETAGFYAIASILAKTIFFGTQPISKALFPLSAENKKKGHNLLANSLGIILVCIVPALIAFYFFPGLLIRIFSGRYILEAQNVIFYIAVAMSLLSITNLVLLYKLSLGKIKNYLIFLIFPIIQSLLLFFFSSNLVEFSIALITASAIFLWGAIFLLDRN